MSEETRLEEMKTVIRRMFIFQILLVIVYAGCMVWLLLYSKDHLYSILFALLTGCGGGSIALVQRLHHQRTEAVRLMASSWYATLMPVAYAGGMALVAYLLFMGVILTGEKGGGLFTSNLFPSFWYPKVTPETLNWQNVYAIRPKGVEDFAKLLVWCFLAGYSEQFVSRFLVTLERQGPGKSN